MVSHFLSFTVGTDDSFDVRHFDVAEGLHELFVVDLEVVSRDQDVDLDAIIGQPARFSLRRSPAQAPRFWEGVVTSIERTGIEPEGLATYQVVMRPKLWMLTQSRNYRIFQQLSDPATVLQVLAGWGIKPLLDYDPGQYKGRKYRVQYAESDYHFIRRLLEDAGVTFLFEERDGHTELVLTDAPQARSHRAAPVPYENNPSGELLRDAATAVRVKRTLRPGRYTQRDVDYRRPPEFPLMASSATGTAVETSLERFHHNYGAFLFSSVTDGSSPTADDHGAARTDLGMGERQVARRIAAKRHNARRCVFETTAHDLAPGSIFTFAHFPGRDLTQGVMLMGVRGRLTGNNEGEWRHEVDSFFANQPYHPPLSTPKPQTKGVESATVVGPLDEEIHTDEFGRVRVHFHWDRGGGRNEGSSCWIPVSQPWGGASFGAVAIPRVGQEVLIDFLGADPDRPVVVGRVFTKTQPVPYELPKYKTVNGIRSQSAYRMVAGGSGGGPPGTPSPPVSPMTMPTGTTSPLDFEALQEALNGDFGAVSPNSMTQLWRGSELTFDDQFGREVFYMQAERDMNTMVRRNQTSVICGRRATKVGSDDVLNVGHDQLTVVGNHRCVSVDGTQVHQVRQEIAQQCLEGDQIFDTCKTWRSEAKDHLLESEESLSLVVGQSILHMRPDFVILQTPYLFLNPGEAETEAAIKSGARPLTPEEAAEQAAAEAAAADAATEARVAAYESEIDQMYANRDIPPTVNEFHSDNFRSPSWGETQPSQSAMEEWQEARTRWGLGRPTFFNQPGVPSYLPPAS